MASARFFVCLVLAALVSCALGQYLQPIAGARDISGGYYDNYSGQYSSAITGRVYNTAPAVVAAPAIAAPAIAAPAIAAAPIAAAPIAWIRR